MSKITYYMTMTIGLAILMKLAGIPYVGSDTLLNLLGLNIDNLSVSTSFFVITLITSLGIAATLGSIFSKESSIRAGIIIAIGIMGFGIGTFIGIFNYVKDIAQGTQTWVLYVVFMIMSIYIVGYILAIVDFWGGTG